MSKKRLIAAAALAAIGWYYSSQPNDGTANSPPLAGIVGGLFGAIPQAIGLAGTTAQIAWAAEGAALGFFGAKYLP